MKIQSVKDVRDVSDAMHDSEFGDSDFGFEPRENTFFLKSYSPFLKEFFSIKLYNVERYQTINLEKIKEGKSVGGVFNYIKIKNNELELILFSQDLQIILKLSKIEGEFKRSKEIM